jgi:gliding motility-associated-like protein
LGNIRTYQLKIFDRWGQKIFDTADFTESWEGKFGGMAQPSRVYVWLCHYQFEGETEQSKTGTVFLLR